MSSAGGRGGMGAGNTGFFFVRLKPRSERELTADEVVSELRPKLAQVPGSASSSRTRRRSRSAAAMTRSQYQFTLQSPDTDELYRVAPLLEQKLRDSLPGWSTSPPTCCSRTRRSTSTSTATRRRSLGVTAQQIEDALYTAYGSRQISTIYAPNNQYQVILELLPEYQSDPRPVAALRALDDRASWCRSTRW